MIDLYFWTTDNGYKARIVLEETGLEYKLNPVQLPKKEQMSHEYRKISPGHKIPAIVDHDGPGGQPVTLCESGAILKYAAEKSGKLYPSDAVARIKVDQWLFYGSSTFTPLTQQFSMFMFRFPEDVPPAKQHYDAQYRDMLETFNGHLADNEFLAGDFSIADISTFPDVHQHDRLGVSLDEYPNVKRWNETITARSATERALAPI